MWLGLPERDATASTPMATHTVVAGDTLSAIARRFDVTIAEIRAKNPRDVGANGSIRVGAKLSVPLVDTSNRLPRAVRLRPERLRLRPIIHKWAKRNGLPPELVEATLYLESGWNQQRVSSTGAIGVGQLMPATATYVKTHLIGRAAGGHLLNPYNTEDNIRLSARYLRHLIHSNGGNVRKALHTYYQGAGSISRNGLYDDTKAYASSVLALRTRFRSDRTGL